MKKRGRHCGIKSRTPRFWYTLYGEHGQKDLIRECTLQSCTSSSSISFSLLVALYPMSVPGRRIANA
eukprot:2895198-Rhodomonas_salina.3